MSEKYHTRLFSVSFFVVVGSFVFGGPQATGTNQIKPKRGLSKRFAYLNDRTGPPATRCQ